jgi:uncharacterized OB-fold protein
MSVTDARRIAGECDALVLPEAIATLVKTCGNGCLGFAGGRCRQCGKVSFPPQRRSFCCQEENEPVALDGCGQIYSYTIVRTSPPFGLPEPYAVGYIDLKGVGVRVFGLFAPESLANLELGASVQLQVRPMGKSANGDDCLRPVFSLLSFQEVTS